MSNEDHDREQKRLHKARHDQRDLGAPVAVQCVRHVKERRATRWPSVHYFKESLERTIKINQRLGEAFEDKLLVAFIPPPMRLAFG